MARRDNFFAAPRSVFALAVLISLSVTTECLQCYWCGPLAEQVHRSQRAQPCNDLENQVTACEPGYTHCAVVATSPPYIESRYCVKFYQDECYTLYCNTTKTYKTTCPCQGELCNGKNTQREIDAFAVVTKAVGKPQHTKIIKKRDASLSNIEGSNDINQDKQDGDDNTHPHDSKTAETDKLHDVIETNINESIKSNETKSSANDNEMQGDQPVDETEQVDTNVPVDTNDLIKSNENNEPNLNRNDKKDVESPLVGTKEITTHAVPEDKIEVNFSTTSKAIELTTAATHTLKVEESSYINNDIKPSMQLPTAEALQQNSAPIVTATTEKASDQTTESTTDMSTTEHIVNPTVKPTDSNRNNAPQESFNFILLLNSLIFKYGF